MNSSPSAGGQSLPKHIGDNVLPNFPIFNRLLFFASNRDKLVINDTTNGLQATHQQLLSDVLYLRNALWTRLDSKVRNRLLAGEEICVNLLAAGGYEFATAFLALLALGAVIVPISASIPVHEAMYFAKTSRSIGVLYSSNFVSMEILQQICKPPLPASNIIISSDHHLNYHGAGLVIFTSGTSGPPKGAVKERSFLDTNAQAVAQWYNLQESDVVLHTLPVHHATGIKFQSSGFHPDQIWERWRQGGLTVFSGVPTMYMRLMKYFEENISKKSSTDSQGYVRAAKSFRLMMSGSAALPFSLQSKWIKLLDGKRILERYGATEFGSVFSVKPGDSNNPDGSVGKPFFGLEVKLSNGTEGEILVKSPHMFREYLYDPVATAAAFTVDGYYKTGDIARSEGDYYFILGRASIDIIKSGGYKISALDIERELLNLSYISEAMVVGVPDEEYGQRVAAAITLRDDYQEPSLRLEKLRADLRSRLAGYKLPTILRVVKDFPKSASGKVVKRVLGKQLFSEPNDPHIQVWRSQKGGQARL
ncbi:AMP-binding enzyme domain-containing protein [Trichoderma breve]|uniref:AMP-binding enzyme domain-containing protein n=1 Tax=Trichoderma breve TaxID=2034170 RepID=A0A9W9E322_9HYPO|nr:AMP-binding enzyme domain-containing protein [Trichoderma breve]KAJ4854632.1 AMP-binding enzyme domain-containing protein [Trichoderma breve]